MIKFNEKALEAKIAELLLDARTTLTIRIAEERMRQAVAAERDAIELRRAA